MKNKTLGIFAPGLLGASIGMAVGDRHPFGRVAVWARREEARRACERATWCDLASSSVEEVATESDFLVLCPPVDVIPQLFADVAPFLGAGAIVTDVGSTKEEICRAIASLPRGEVFIGSHPMAGSEKSGMAAARADLFAGAPCVVTPETGKDSGRVAAVCEFWRGLGGVIHQVSPGEHDEIVAAVSHLPHLAAAALARVVLGEGARGDFSGAGLRDTTRIAAGDPGLWVEIVRQNRPRLQHQMELLQAELTMWQDVLASGDDAMLRDLLASAQQLRKAL